MCLCFVDRMDMSSRPPLTPGGGPVGGRVGDTDADSDATAGVTALYQAHAVGLIRLAIVMLGDRGAAEDVVQDAFLGLYRHWDRLPDPGDALTYVPSAGVHPRPHGRRERHDRQGPGPMASESAEAVALIGEEHQQVLAAIRALPDRRREALVLRFYLDLSEEETARAMGVSRGAVKSATSRAVAALGRKLMEGS